MSNEFWTFSLEIYACSEVAEACVAAQDALGLDVNLLLYAAWLAVRERQLTPEHLAGLEGGVRQWQERVIVPLRGLRRTLKEFLEADGIRQGVGDLELRAEQYQQDVMWAYFNSASVLPPNSDSLDHNLALLIKDGMEATSPWNTLVVALRRNLPV